MDGRHQKNPLASVLRNAAILFLACLLLRAALGAALNAMPQAPAEPQETEGQKRHTAEAQERHAAEEREERAAAYEPVLSEDGSIVANEVVIFMKEGWTLEDGNEVLALMADMEPMVMTMHNEYTEEGMDYWETPEPEVTDPDSFALDVRFPRTYSREELDSIVEMLEASPLVEKAYLNRVMATEPAVMP